MSTASSGSDCRSTLPEGTLETSPEGILRPWQSYSFRIFELLILYKVQRGTCVQD